MGYEIAPRPEQCGTTAKTSECQRAGHKKRGSRGQGPRRSFLRLSPEKAGLPPGAGRETTLQVWTCDGPNPAPLPEAARCCVPFGWAGRLPALGRSAPGGPPARRGPHFSREMGRKRAGGKPPGPPFLWPARSHSLVLALGAALFRSWGYYGAHVRALIWGAFSCGATQPRGFPLGGSCLRR